MIDIPEINWPDPAQEPPGDTSRGDLYKARYQAKLDELKAKQDAMRKILQDAQANDYTCGQVLYSAYLDVAKGQIDRSQTRATSIVTAAGAITTIYTGILGLAFGLGQVKHELPIRGLVPAVFLGSSIVFVTVYLAYITQAHDILTTKPSGLLSLRLIEERDDFIRWTSEIVRRRIPWLHTSVISLGFGVAFLPIAFIDMQDYIAWIVTIPCIVIMLLPLLVARIRVSRSQANSSRKP